MSRHIATPAVRTSPPHNSPRPAAERRVLEQLHRTQAAPARRTLPRPAATSTVQVDALPHPAAARSRRPRSRLSGASAQPLPADNGQLLHEILDEFPEIDATTVSVLLEMHKNEREPVVQRLEEVYRRPGKAPQKRHSFPSSSPREHGRRSTGQQSRMSMSSNRSRRAPLFSVDRIDDDEEDDGIGDEEGSNDDNYAATAADARRSVEQGHSRTSHASSNTPPEAPIAQTARSSTSASSVQRRSERSRAATISNADSSSSTHKPRTHKHRKRSFRRSRDTEGSGSDAASAHRPPPRREERASDPLLAPWGQDASPRPRGDAVPPVMLAPHALRSRSRSRSRSRDQSPRPAVPPPFAALNAPLSNSVVAESSSVRFRVRPQTPGTTLLRPSPLDDEGAAPPADGDDASVSSSGTASSLTRGSPGFSSAVSSAISSVRSAERPGSGAASQAAAHATPLSREDGESVAREGHEVSAISAAAAVMRSLTTSGRQSRNSNASEGSGGQLSRRRRAKRSVRELGHAMRDKARQYRDGWSEGEHDDHEELHPDDRRRPAGTSVGDHDFSSVDGNDGSDDVAVRSTCAQELLIAGDPTEALSAAVADANDGGNLVHVEKTLLQSLIRKVNTAERTLHKLQTERSQKVAQLVAAVNDVSSSMVNYDMRQQRRFEHLSERFTGNNDSIERLTNDMWSIRRMLHDYETRRSRRFWRMVGMLLLDSLAYVGLILVWLCTSVYNLFARQRRAIARLFVSGPAEADGKLEMGSDDDSVDEDDGGYVRGVGEDFAAENELEAGGAGSRRVRGGAESSARLRRGVGGANISTQSIG